MSEHLQRELKGFVQNFDNKIKQSLQIVYVNVLHIHSKHMAPRLCRETYHKLHFSRRIPPDTRIDWTCTRHSGRDRRKRKYTARPEHP